MTGNQLLEKLAALSDDERKLSVNFGNNGAEIRDVNVVRFTRANFSVGYGDITYHYIALF